MRTVGLAIAGLLGLSACDQGPPSWQVETSRDALRDSWNFDARLTSKENPNAVIAQTGFDVRSSNDSVQFGWDTPLASCTSDRLVAYRFDSEPIAYLGCSPVRYGLETSSTQAFADRFYQPSHTLVLEGLQGQYVFNTVGLSDAINNARLDGRSASRR